MLTRPKLTKFQIAVHVAALIPLALLIWDATQGNLTANPIQKATLRTGKTALVLLVLSLAATPVNTVFGFRQAIKVRRALGLYAFFYAAIHFTIYFGIDYGFDLNLVGLELAEKRYVLVGFAAFLILVPLAITSTRGWQRRLKKGWKRLHRFVYAAGILVVVHYTWVVKSDIREPLIWGGIVALLLILRIPVVRHKVVSWRMQLVDRVKDGSAATSGA
ncbi:MAG: protein-methionine-sulfoxide reductase heme-binding subunit MsrQ [Chloroflexota bacterium]|nr:protein-methionine-sulfoxide reductase heme-binding subunit MsrQ [Chloroflexota bacterium]